MPIQTITHKITWIDIEKPTKKDLEYLKERFNFHPLVMEELLSSTLTPRVDSYDNYIFTIFHLPLYPKRRDGGIKASELDILITRDTLITVHYHNILSLRTFFANCSDNKFKEKYLNRGTGELLYYIMETLLKPIPFQLDNIEKKIENIEKRLFRGNTEKETIEKISLAKREILDLWRILKPQEGLLNALPHKSSMLWGKELKPYFADLVGDYARIWNILENQMQTINMLHLTNESLLTTKTNEIMKVLTIFAVITFPLTLLASVFGMNTRILPLTGSNYDFWIIIGIMAITTSGMFIYFKKKGWL